jgi:hypothetical protein
LKLEQWNFSVLHFFLLSTRKECLKRTSRPRARFRRSKFIPTASRSPFKPRFGEKRMKLLAIGLSLILLPAGLLAQSREQPADVSKEVERRTGHPLPPMTKSTVVTMPVGVSLDDGVTEDEAISIALWNNPSLQAEMTALGLARADLIQAGMIANPQLTMIFPFSMRVLEAVASWPIEAIWQRPRRVAAARLE